MSKQEQDYSHSLSDLMASLAVVFLLIAAAAIFQIRRAENKGKDVHAANLRKLKEELQESFKTTLRVTEPKFNECVAIENRSMYRLTIVFKACPMGLGFDSGEYKLKPSQSEYVENNVTPIFRRICETSLNDTKKGYLIEGVALTGHTDSAGLASTPEFQGCRLHLRGDTASARSSRDGFCNNVQLSTRRAQTVFFMVRTKLQEEDQSKTKHLTVPECIDKIFTVSGNGPTRPIDKSRSWTSEFNPPSSFDEDRRVELSIDFKQPAI